MKRHYSKPTLLTNFASTDSRGYFHKVYFKSIAMQIPDFGEIKEIFFTKSIKNTIRGMHYQAGETPAAKLVWVSEGEIEDVLIDLSSTDLRNSSQSFILNSTSPNILFVPPNFAHGFQVLSEFAIVNYAVNADYDSNHDFGIRWDSFNYQWLRQPSIISERDLGHETLEEFYARSI